MEDEMYDDDVDLIEQVSDEDEDDEEDDDDDDEEAMETEQQQQQAAQQQQQQQQRPRGNRLTDQVNMDDEPVLAGYERYECRTAARILRRIRQESLLGHCVSKLTLSLSPFLF